MPPLAGLLLLLVSAKGILLMGLQQEVLRGKEAINVADFLASLIKTTLGECHPVLLTQEDASPHLHLTLQLLQKRMNVAAFVYNVRDFIEAPAPGTTFLQYRREDGVKGKIIFCITYILLLEKSSSNLALHHIPRGGAKRYFIDYCGENFHLRELEDDPVFLKAYDTLFLSPDASYSGGDDTSDWPYSLFFSCPFCKDGEAQVLLRNKWDPVRGYMKKGVELFPDEFRNMNGRMYRGCSLIFEPFIEFSGGSEFEPVTKLDSLDLRVMDTIAAHLNFTYEVYLPADRKWGTQLPNGSFNGVIGTIARYEADFSMDVSITADRDYHVDFTRGFTTDPLVITMSRPKPLPQWLSLVRPYQELVWLCFLTALVAAGPSYWALQKVSLTSKPETLARACFIMYAAMLTQSRHWPVGAGLRVFVALWLFFGLVVTTSYIGNLTAFLTVPVFSPTVNSLEELAESDFSWGVKNNSAADYQLFKFSKEPLYKKIFAGLDLCSSLEDCVQRTLHEHYAFITWKTHVLDAIARKFIDKNGEPLIYIAREGFFPGPIGFALQKGSPLKRNLDQVIQSLTEGGLVNQWLKEVIDAHGLEALQRKKEEAAFAEREAAARGEPPPEDGNGNSHLALTLYHLQGVFFLFAVGITFSAVLFACEILLFSCSPTR